MLERTEEILKAVDTLLTVHDEWERDDKAPQQPTEQFEYAVNDAVRVGDAGDIPARCRDLCVALNRLGIEWDKYAAGNRTPDFRPLGSFWGAFREVVSTRAAAEPAAMKQPEPVCVLLDQKVPHYQIAHHIWGYQGKGPFVVNGQVDSMKIIEEGKHPGKHTAGWQHPEQIQRQREDRAALSRRLGAAERRENRDERVVEKATVVELLKEGQYPDVIAKVKGLSLETVLEEAKRHSITPSVLPNLAAERAPQERRTVPESDVSPESELEDDDDGEEELEQEDAPAAKKVSNVEFIRSLNDGTRGEAEIHAACKKDGRRVTFAQIKEVLEQATA